MHCGDCRFWFQPATQCRRNAPMPARTNDAKQATHWPQVAANDWCGEYQPGYIDRPMPGVAEGRRPEAAH